MKKYHILMLVFLLVTQLTVGQKPVTISNHDKKTRAMMKELVKITAARFAGEIATYSNLTKAIRSHEEQMKKQYTKNYYDKINKSRWAILFSVAKSEFTKKMGAYKLPYITNTKKEYLKAIARDKLILLTLLSISPDKIKSGKRQEIYQLRNKLIREFSKTDRTARQTFMLPIAGAFLQNPNMFKKAKKVLDNLEIPM